jgi:hypothetical protein
LTASGAIAYILAKTGKRAAAERMLPNLQKQTSVALVTLALGDRDAALNAVDQARRDRERAFPYVSRDPRFKRCVTILAIGP